MLCMQGSEEEALAGGAPTGSLAPAWRVILLSDGSVTRHLQLLTGLRVEVVRACTPLPAPGASAERLPRRCGSSSASTPWGWTCRAPVKRVCELPKGRSAHCRCA